MTLEVPSATMTHEAGIYRLCHNWDIGHSFSLSLPLSLLLSRWNLRLRYSCFAHVFDPFYRFHFYACFMHVFHPLDLFVNCFLHVFDQFDLFHYFAFLAHVLDLFDVFHFSTSSNACVQLNWFFSILSLLNRTHVFDRLDQQNIQECGAIQLSNMKMVCTCRCNIVGVIGTRVLIAWLNT
jgi:hypothetical protein